MVPVAGFELATYRLQGGCSTPELNRRGVRNSRKSGICHLACCGGQKMAWARRGNGQVATDGLRWRQCCD